jgi:nicotinamidase-related amidase
MKHATLHIFAAGALAAMAIGMAPAAHAGDIVADWAGVKAPPPPPVNAVTVDPKTTALLMLDFLKQNCGKRPRCVATVPAVAKLLGEARAAKATVIYSYFPKHSVADILDKRLDPVAGEASVTSTADKFINTDLEKMLKDKGIKTVIVVGTAANGAVLCTGTDAGLRGYQVIVPVDGISSVDTYSEQFSTWQLAHGPTFGNRVTITRIGMVKF